MSDDDYSASQIKAAIYNGLELPGLVRVSPLVIDRQVDEIFNRIFLDKRNEIPLMSLLVDLQRKEDK